jgi:CheY-like chemotaxis protein
MSDQVRNEPVRNLAHRRILIADDAVDTREMYAVYLEMDGYNVERAENGYETVLKARVVRPDLIVLDLQMPKLDGWGALRELQKDVRTSTIPVIVLTGHDLKDYLKYSAFAEGATAYFTKPILPERLAHEIALRLADPRAQPQIAS